MKRCRVQHSGDDGIERDILSQLPAQVQADSVIREIPDWLGTDTGWSLHLM